jgi:hypothetical protein
VASPRDISNLSALLLIDEEEFTVRYTELSGGKTQIRTGDDGNCIFFVRDIGCAVHRAKPAVCRAWPFFRGNIVDPESLEQAKGFCPGISPFVSHADFAMQGRKYLSEHKLLASDPTCEANTLILS